MVKKTHEFDHDFKSTFRPVNVPDPLTDYDGANKHYVDNAIHGALPIPIIGILSDHENPSSYQLDSASDEYIMIRGKAPANYDFVNHVVRVFIECAWKVAPGAGPYQFAVDLQYKTSGEDMSVWDITDQHVAVSTSVLNLKKTLTFDIAANVIAAGDLIGIKFHEHLAGAGQTFYVYGISLEMVP